MDGLQEEGKLSLRMSSEGMHHVASSTNIDFLQVVIRVGVVPEVVSA